MMKRRLIALLPALFLGFAACGDDDDSNPAGGGGSGTGTINVTVSSGTNPTYTWDGGDLFTVSVVETAAPTVPVWNVTTPGTDGIASGVTHGTVPAGAIEVFAVQTTLNAGTEYRVSVSRVADSAIGFTDFTP